MSTRRTNRPTAFALRTRTRQLLATAALAAVAALGVTAAPAQALPPGGASADTEGTSASVSPSSLRAGATISFRISGFPAGETVSVKIDDGDFCSEKGVHGACVVHQQKIATNGTVQGSFALPDDLGAGRHWLRFLASAEMTDSEGRYVGVKPYSLRGGANFTVVAAEQKKATKPRTSSPTTQSGGGSPTTAAPEAGAGPTATPVEGAAGTQSEDEADETPDEQTEEAGEVASSAPEVLTVPAPPGSAGKSAVSVDRAADEVPADDVVAPAADTDDEFPWIGAVVLALAVVLTGAWVLRSRARA